MQFFSTLFVLQYTNHIENCNISVLLLALSRKLSPLFLQEMPIILNMLRKSLICRYAAHCLWKAVQVAISAVRNRIYSIKISKFKKHRQSIEGCSNSYDPNGSIVRDISSLRLLNQLIWSSTSNSLQNPKVMVLPDNRHMRRW